MRNPGCDRALSHVDLAVEPRAVDEDDAVCAQATLDLRLLRQLDSLRRNDGPLDPTLHQHAHAADVGADVRLIGDGQLRLTDLHLSVHAAVDGDVLGARDLAGDDDRRTDGGHGAENTSSWCLRRESNPHSLTGTRF